MEGRQRSVRIIPSEGQPTLKDPTAGVLWGQIEDLLNVRLGLCHSTQLKVLFGDLKVELRILGSRAEGNLHLVDGFLLPTTSPEKPRVTGAGFGILGAELQGLHKKMVCLLKIPLIHGKESLLAHQAALLQQPRCLHFPMHQTATDPADHEGAENQTCHGFGKINHEWQ